MKFSALMAVAIQKFNEQESFTEGNGWVSAYRCLHAASDAVKEVANTTKIAAGLCVEADSQRAVTIKLDQQNDEYSMLEAESMLQYLQAMLVYIVEKLMLQDRAIARRDQERAHTYS